MAKKNNKSNIGSDVKVYIMDLERTKISYNGKIAKLTSKYVFKDDEKCEKILKNLTKHFNESKSNEIFNLFKNSVDDEFKFLEENLILKLKKSDELNRSFYFYEKVEDPESFEILYEHKTEIE